MKGARHGAFYCGKFQSASYLQLVFGGRHGIRTHDPHVANVVLSQLS
jgi:hypothetical protein